jgi:hypothetical protein
VVTAGALERPLIVTAEMHFVPIGPDSWYNLPRDGGVAYAAQESWVQNETIKVVFDFISSSKTDDEWYRITLSSVPNTMKNATRRSSISVVLKEI